MGEIRDIDYPSGLCGKHDFPKPIVQRVVLCGTYGVLDPIGLYPILFSRKENRTLLLPTMEKHAFLGKYRLVYFLLGNTVYFLIGIH